MSASIAIVDYGMGNLASVAKALRHLGAEPRVVSSVEEIDGAGHLILPGVGAFGDAMKRLKSQALIDPLVEYLRSGRPFLGICLGMQLLFGSSEETRGAAGLGFLPGRVRRLRTSLKVPHIGWNTVDPVAGAALFDGVRAPCFYFVHSFVVEPEEAAVIWGRTSHGEEFPSVIGKGPVWGVQFHPEKSQQAGLRVLQNFLRATRA